MINCIVEIRNIFNTKWFFLERDGWDIWLKAKVCRQNRYVTIDVLHDMFLKEISKCDVSQIKSVFLNFVSSLNGSFAIIAKSRSWLLVAVDHMRSIPLFYAQKENNILISDSAKWILDQFENTVPDKQSSVEFLLCGYVTGADTIFAEVKQLQADEILFSNLLTGDIQLQFAQKSVYHQLLTINNCHIEQMENILTQVFLRLTDSIKEKTIVVPLSDGYDSRLIVTMLSRLKVEDVICFTYAKAGAKILQTAKKVAQKVGYPWLFVPYDKKTWQACLNDHKTIDFIKKSHNLSTLPNIQDFPAIKYLHEQNLIPPNAVFLPGHTPMMYLHGQPDHATLSNVIDTILRKHYTRWDLGIKKRKLMPMLRNKIKKALPEDFFIDSAEKAVQAFESWELRERQAKFIVNSVRTYEFFGYEWRLPLWDKELVKFWLVLPLSLRNKKMPIKKFLNGEMQQVHELKKLTWKRECLRNIKNFLMEYPVLFYILNKFDIRPSRVLSYWTNPLGFYGVTSLKEFISAYHYNINAHSFLAKKLYAEEYDREFAHALTYFFNKSLPSLRRKQPTHPKK